MRRNTAVVGLQWGDEGKGKIVDMLAKWFDCVARYAGGHNAGHTVYVEGKKRVLHLIPSGIFHDRVVCVIGNGVVIDVESAADEIEMVETAGATVRGRLFISNRAHVILPTHKLLDAVKEARRGKYKIGTTGRGIGPAYEDKAGRNGIRICDLFHPSLKEKIVRAVSGHNNILIALGSNPVNPKEVCERFERFAELLQPFVVDTTTYLNRMIRGHRPILFEGAQAALLDVDHGTVPFVTSSNASVCGIPAGLGIAPKFVGRVIGITKAFTTRVGEGPFPTEILGKTAEIIRTAGNEFGSTTGRPRRCGWLDGPALKYACMINAPDSIIVTKLDVLDELPEIQFCTGYEYKGSMIEDFPAQTEILGEVVPVYTTLPGWRSKTTGIRDRKDLPTAAQEYLEYLSSYLQIEISGVSIGPNREDYFDIPTPPQVYPPAV